MNFPLYRRPGGIVFLDDDPAYLEMLAMVMPRHWRVELFVRPQDCINRLQQEPPLWETDAWQQQQIVNRWREGHALVPQILSYWNENPSRFGLTHVCVVDYSMPGLNGLQVLAELVDWPGARVLLTGRADEQIAVNAFNHGLIEQFIAKQTYDVTRRLAEVVQRLLDMPYARHSNVWRSTLSPEQDTQLRNPSIARDLARLSEEHRWVEHVVIGNPFGVLALDAAGTPSWLQLEKTARLGELAELAESQGVPAGTVAQIRNGQQLINLELKLALKMAGAPDVSEAQALGADRTLTCAYFSLAGHAEIKATHSYGAFLARYADRTVHQYNPVDGA